MKRAWKVFALTLPIMGLFLVGCTSKEDKVIEAADQISQAEATLEEAKEDYQLEIQKFKEENAKQLSQNEKSILEFNERIANQKSDAKLKYEKQIKELNKKNSDMQMRMDNLKYESQSSWDLFKEAFNKDMEALAKAIREFTTTDSDEQKK
jgi:TolA-binding protein